MRGFLRENEGVARGWDMKGLMVKRGGIIRVPDAVIENVPLGMDIAVIRKAMGSWEGGGQTRGFAVGNGDPFSYDVEVVGNIGEWAGLVAQLIPGARWRVMGKREESEVEWDW